MKAETLTAEIPAFPKVPINVSELKETLSDRTAAVDANPNAIPKNEQ